MKLVVVDALLRHLSDVEQQQQNREAFATQRFMGICFVVQDQEIQESCRNVNFVHYQYTPNSPLRLGRL